MNKQILSKALRDHREILQDNIEIRDRAQADIKYSLEKIQEVKREAYQRGIDLD